jgi:hypothetical protein
LLDINLCKNSLNTAAVDAVLAFVVSWQQLVAR